MPVVRGVIILSRNLITKTLARLGRCISCTDPLGDRVSSNTGPDSLKIAKLPSQHSMEGHHRHANETPIMAFRWCADNGPLIVVLGSSIPSSTKKKVVEVRPHLTKRSGSAHAKAGLRLSYATKPGVLR